jgi:transposase
MARVAAHLSVSALEESYRGAKEATAARHFQAIWLLAKGHTIPEVSELTSFGTRWLEQLLARYNADGPAALGDRRRHNGRAPSILKPELLARLRERLEAAPPDGGLWSGPKVAAWLAGELGLERVAPQRGWEALRAIDWTIQVPRPQHPEAATAKEREAFKKSLAKWSKRKPGAGRTRRSRSSPATSTGWA